MLQNRQGAVNAFMDIDWFITSLIPEVLNLNTKLHILGNKSFWQ